MTGLCGLVLLGLGLSGASRAASDPPAPLPSTAAATPPPPVTPASLAAPSWPAVGHPDPLVVRQIAPGVWVHQGQIADFDAGNAGDVANLGFVIGRRCVAVVDTGGSRQVGAALLAAIRQQTALPVCYVIASHMHPDHLLGHAAFRDEHPQFVAAARQARALAARSQGYLERQGRLLGNAAAGTEVVLADHPVETEDTLDLGGRQLSLRAWHTAHTDNDLTVLDSQTGTLFTGDLLFSTHLPVIDGSLRGWLGVIDALQPLSAGPLVPGHGPLLSPGEGPAALQRERDYLAAVAAEVRAALRARRTLAETVDATMLPAGWELAGLYHRRNVTAAYAELEWED